jgi:phosphonate transport system substrate-binding protein
MAENSEDLCREVAQYVESNLKISTEYISAIPWEERQRLFDRGEIEILWLCGLPYVNRADLVKSKMEILAAPVPAGERYGARPIYFSDVVVRTGSRFRSFVELRGASWAYNEPRSHSGFNLVRFHLSQLGENRGFFSATYQSGAHSASIEMILSGAVDGAAIDSTVLEWSAVKRKELMDQVRVIHTLGPSPIPPWVISKRVPGNLRAELRALLIGMEKDSVGRIILERSRISRFVSAKDCDYDPIRIMAARAEEVLLA